MLRTSEIRIFLCNWGDWIRPHNTWIDESVRWLTHLAFLLHPLSIFFFLFFFFLFLFLFCVLFLYIFFSLLLHCLPVLCLLVLFLLALCLPVLCLLVIFLLALCLLALSLRILCLSSLIPFPRVLFLISFLLLIFFNLFYYPLPILSRVSCSSFLTWLEERSEIVSRKWCQSVSKPVVRSCSIFPIDAIVSKICCARSVGKKTKSCGRDLYEAGWSKCYACF